MNKKGLWLDNHTFVPLSNNKIQLQKSIASRKTAFDFFNLGNWLPDPDIILKKQNKDIKIYRDLLIDDQAWSCFQSRKSGVKSLNWQINKGLAKTTHTKIITSLFEDMNIRNIISEILDATWYGFQPLEIIWGKVGNYILPVKIEGKPPEWFCFDTENRLRFRSKDNYMDGELVPEKKFLLPRYNPSYLNPYGERLASRCFWPISFKKGGIKFWVTFIEKYGMPFMIGKHPRSTEQNETNRLLDMMESAITDAVMAIPDDSNVEIIEPSSKGDSSALYDKFYNKMDSAISKIILSQTLTTEVSEKGSYAASKTHADIRQDIVDDDKHMTENVFNTLISWIWDLNFIGEKPKFSLWAEEDVDKDLADRDQTLSNTGVRFTKKYYMKNYGFDEEDIIIQEESKEPETKQPFSESEDFSEGSIIQDLLYALSKLSSKDNDIDDELDDIDKQIKDNELQQQLEQELEPVFSALKSSKDLKHFSKRLSLIYPDMNSSQLLKTVQKAIYISDLWGQANEK